MGKLIDMTGQKIGYLTVLNLDEIKTKQNKQAYWICKCDCGNLKSISRKAMKSGNTSSCGCLRRKTASKNTYKDLTGQKFGRLTVLADSQKRKDNRVIWTCLCDCGNKCEIDTNRLTSGNTSSCGCKHQDFISNLTKNDLTNQRFGKLIALYPTLKRIDNKIVWHCLCDCGNECEIIGTHLTSGKTSSCGCVKSSIGEINIIKILSENNLIFQKEYTFKDLKSNKNHLLRYDFYLPNYNRLIEFDGEQHYRNTGWNDCKEIQQNDNIKNNYAISHGIDLVRIPYWERDNITLEMILGDKYLVKE